MTKLTDIKQAAYLQFKGIDYDHFERQGKLKILVYKESQEEIDKHIADFYKSDISKYISYLENLRTMAYRA